MPDAKPVTVPIPELPPGAVGHIDTRHPDGSPESARYLVGEEQVSFRQWDEDGVLEHLITFRDGKRSGPALDWLDGQIISETHYVDGLEHGLARQWDGDGNLIGAYRMKHGTGADLWFYQAGILAEERYYLEGVRHRYERWWSLDNRTVRDEQHYVHGKSHGVFRRWNRRGRLCRGYPQYCVHGERVDKRRYLRAARSDATLPPFRLEDNSPERPLPPGAQDASPIALK